MLFLKHVLVVSLSTVMIFHKLPSSGQLHQALGALSASQRAASRRLYSSHRPPTTKYPETIFKVSEEVAEAVQSGKPVVALETTIYTHGYPYPDNVSLATHLESVVRINGAIPATIGVLHGVARVGLSQSELVELAAAAGKKDTMKVSRRDLPFITGLVRTSHLISFSRLLSFSYWGNRLNHHRVYRARN